VGAARKSVCCTKDVKHHPFHPSFRIRMSAPSESHLCKSVIFKNTKRDNMDISGKVVDKLEGREC
jgi:hypothetical protein